MKKKNCFHFVLLNILFSFFLCRFAHVSFIFLIFLFKTSFFYGLNSFCSFFEARFVHGLNPPLSLLVFAFIFRHFRLSFSFRSRFSIFFLFSCFVFHFTSMFNSQRRNSFSFICHSKRTRQNIFVFGIFLGLFLGFFKRFVGIVFGLFW